MTLELLGSPVNDHDELPERPGGHTPHHEADTGPAARRNRQPALWIVAIAGVLVGGIALALAVPQLAPISAGAPRQSPAPAGAAGLAELYVATYLTRGGEPGALAAFGVDDALVADMTPNQRYVTHVATTNVAPHGEAAGLWVATVVAETLVLRPESGYAPAEPTRLGVTLGLRDGELAVFGLPAPAPDVRPRLRPLPVTGDVTAAQREAVEGFLDAWLGRSDPVSRWAAGAALELAEPPRHTAVALGGLWQGATPDQAIAIVGADDASGLRVTYAMTLTITDIGGALMVTDLVPGTALATPAASDG